MVMARGVTKTYRSADRQTPVLRGVDLDVARGELVAIVGPSGSGKSTLLHILGALDRPDEGEVSIDGIRLAELGEEARARLRNERIGFVFQFHHLLPDFDALENVEMPGRVAGWPRSRCRERARELLSRVGLVDRSEHYPSQLSGGERQRIALCRALVLEPLVVLADEPTGNLDSTAGEEVIGLLGELQEERSTTAIVVTHNPDVAGRCGRILELLDGTLRDRSGPEERGRGPQ